MKLARKLIPDIPVLQAFECAARHGNFTQAAAELNLTQSAVSRQIKLLEDQLGVTLFERIRKRVVLSSSGRKLLPEVRQLLAQTEELVLRARASARGTTFLSVATLPTFGSRWLVPRLADFLGKNPGVAVEVASKSEPFDFAVEHFDVAIHYGQPVWPQATCTYLCSEQIVPVASPRLLEAAGEGRNAITRAPLLHLSTRPRQWEEWLDDNGIGDIDPYQGSRFDQFGMMIEGVVHGLGIALLPLYLIEQEIRSGVLTQLPGFEPMTTPNAYYVVLPEGSSEGSLGQRFQSWAASMIGTRI